MTTKTKHITSKAMYRVTERGLEQIKQWLLHEWYCEADEVAALDEAVHAYADKAEDAEDGEIELRAWETASGRIAYLRPERVVVLHEYRFYTDAASGIIEAEDWEDACAQLDAMIPAACQADGGYGVLRDHLDGHDDYVVGTR